MAAGDLTTLAAVRSLLGETDAAQTANDSEIGACITAASRAIHVYAAQEFAPLNTGSLARKFAYYGGGRLSLQPYSLNTLTSVQIDTETDEPTTLVEDSDYYVSPRGGTRDGVYDALELPSIPGAGGSKRWREVTVTGTWGYASVPSDVARAAAVLAAWWYRNQSTVPGVSLGGEGDRFGPTSWPTAVLQLLASYRVIGFGYGG